MSVQSEPPVVLRKAGAATAAVLMSQFIDWSSANRKLSPIHRRLACLTRRKRPPYRRRSINVESATQRTCCHSRTDTAPASAAAGRRVGGGGRTCERPGGEKTGAPPPPTHTRPVDSNTSNLRGARFHHLHPFAGYIVSAHIASSFFRFFSGLEPGGYCRRSSGGHPAAGAVLVSTVAARRRHVVVARTTLSGRRFRGRRRRQRRSCRLAASVATGDVPFVASPSADNWALDQQSQWHFLSLSLYV